MVSLKRMLFGKGRGQRGVAPAEDAAVWFRSGDDEWEVLEYREKTSLCDYEDLGLLGVGASATVHAARQKSGGDVVALKIMSKAALTKTVQPANMTRERDIMLHIDSPFVIKMKEAFQTKSSAVYILEHMPAGDMFNYLDSLPGSKLPDKLAKYYAMQLILGLTDIHEAGVIYRDLKLENVLLDSKGNLKLADFGLSRFGSDDTRCGTFVGTAHYMAPEVVSNKGYSMKADWWSLGVLLFAMVTGAHVFKGNTIDQVFKSIMTQPVNFGPYSQSRLISRDAKDFILALLERDESKRLSSLEEARSHKWFQGQDWEALRSPDSAPPSVQQRGFPSISHLVNTYSKAPGQALREPRPDQADHRDSLTALQQQVFHGFDFRVGDAAETTQPDACIQ